MNKLTKLLSVFAIAGAIGTGVAGAAGCAHKHTYSEDWTADGANGHYHLATCEHKEEHDELVPHGTANSEGKCPDCGYQLTTAPSEKLVVAADVTGLMIEGVTAETITLSETKKSHTIDKSAIKVYFAKGANADQKGDEVPAAYVVLELKDGAGAAVSSWENITKDDAYKVNASLSNAEMASGATSTIDDLKATVTVTVSNPIKANSLTKTSTGDTTQVQSSVDSISSQWTFEVERANGEKVAVTGVKITGVNTSEAGENKTATATVTVEGVECTCTVTYTVTPNSTLRTQSYAYNFGVSDHTGAYEDDEYIIDSKPTDHSGTYVLIPGSGAGASSCVKNDGDKPRTSADNEKFFATRITLGGGTFKSDGKFDTDTAKKKYIEIKTESAGKVTVYWSRNSSADNRGLALWKKADALAAEIGANSASSTAVPYDFKGSSGQGTPNKLPVGVVSNIGTGSESLPEKFEFTVPEAGTYYLTTATNQAVYLYYIQVDNEYPNGGVENVVVTPGNKVLSNITVSHTTTDYKQAFNLGDTFSVDTGFTFKGISVAENTAALTEDTLAVSDLEFWLDSTKLTPGTTVLDATLIPETGDKTITVKKGEVTATYKINVASALGVDRVTAALKSDVTTEVANASAQISIIWANFNVTTVGTNENVDVEITAAKYVAKNAPAGTEGTAIVETGTAIGVGDYVVTLTVQVTDKTTTTLTKSFEASCDLSITVAGNEVSWIYHTKNATIDSTNSGYAANSNLVNNNLLTVQSLSELKPGFAMHNEFAAKITDSTNKPVLAAAGTMGNAAITFTNAMAFADKTVKVDIMDGDVVKTPQAAPELLKITANQKIKVYLYLNSSDDKHGSNKTSVGFFVKNGTGEYATTATMTTAARKSVQSFILDLEMGDVVTIKSQLDPTNTSAPADARIWFYGFEAKVVTE